MTLSDFRTDPHWKGAIDLGPKLVRLAEDLPASEEMGLSHRLRNLMVELPATIADDLHTGRQTRRMPTLRLLAALELIDKIYPALDTAATRATAERLAEQILASFNGSATPPAAPSPPEPARADEPLQLEPASVPVVPADTPDEAQPQPEPAQPTRIAVQPAPPQPPVPPAPPA